MIFGVSTKYAWRSLARHGRRTVLSVVGIAVGCALCLLMVGFVRGESELIRRAAAGSGVGHLQIVPETWQDTRSKDLRLDDWASVVETVRDHDGVKVATPRVGVEALLAFGTRMAGVVVEGVDPLREQQSSRLVRHVAEGRYLESDDQGVTVIGRGVAQRLDAGLDYDLMVTVSDRNGEMRSAMLKVVGIIETGSDHFDASICQVNLPEVENLTGYKGATRIVVLLDDPEAIPEMTTALRDALPQSCDVLDWKAIMPELAAGLEFDKTWSRLIISVIITVVFLGIASAQLAAVLERRREFAMLAAVGMMSSQLLRVMMIEGIALGLLGTALGLLLGVPLTWMVHAFGIDFSWVYGDSNVAVANILIDPVLYGDFGWWVLWLALGISLTATILSSFYPAWYAVRTDPAQALRVDH